MARRREEVRQKRAAMQKVLDGIIELLKQADDAYEKAETVAKPLSSKSQQEDLSADELKNVAAEA